MAEKLKIIPLGGLDEIGKNITVLEYGKDMIVVDCGLGFPDEDMYGVDLVIPDFSYLVQNQKKLLQKPKGIIGANGKPKPRLLLCRQEKKKGYALFV